MKKIALITAVGITLALPVVSLESVLAESSSESSSVSSTESSSSGSTSETKKIDKKNWGKRLTPVPLGEKVEVKERYVGMGGEFDAEYTLRIISVARGEEANKKLLEFSEYNKLAVDKKNANVEWAVIEMELDYLSGDEDVAFKLIPVFKVFDMKGKEVSRSGHVIIPENQIMGELDLYPGTQQVGYVAVQVPKDGKFILAQDNFRRKIFFATEKE